MRKSFYVEFRPWNRTVNSFNLATSIQITIPENLTEEDERLFIKDKIQKELDNYVLSELLSSKDLIGP